MKVCSELINIVRYISFLDDFDYKQYTISAVSAIFYDCMWKSQPYKHLTALKCFANIKSCKQCFYMVSNSNFYIL